MFLRSQIKPAIILNSFLLKVEIIWITNLIQAYFEWDFERWVGPWWIGWVAVPVVGHLRTRIEGAGPTGICIFLLVERWGYLYSLLTCQFLILGDPTWSFAWSSEGGWATLAAYFWWFWSLLLFGKASLWNTLLCFHWPY